MKKSLLLMFALLVLGGVNLYATRVYADLSKLGDIDWACARWNNSTNTITWTGTSSNLLTNFDFTAGDYKKYDKIVVSVSNLDNAVGVRLQISANNQQKTVILNGEGIHEKSLLTDFGFSVADLENFEWARILGSGSGSQETHTINAGNPASAKINFVYLNEETQTLDVNLQDMAASAGTATWNKETQVFAWTGTWSNSIALPGLTGNLSAYTTLNYNTEKVNAEGVDHFRILIYYSNGAAQTTYYASVGEKSVTFEEMGVSKANLAAVNNINISGANDVTGSIKLKSVYLEGPATNYIEGTYVITVPEGATALSGMMGADNNKWNVNYPQELSPGTGWCGSIDNDDKSVNISSYDYLHFVVTNVNAAEPFSLRVFVSEESLTDNSKRHCLYPHPIADAAGVENWEAVCNITEPGTYAVKISGYPLLRGFKTGNSGSGTIIVSQAYLSSGDPVLPNSKYVLVGETPGTSSLINALADADATLYDATGLTSTGLELTPTNPNALFVANAGALSNTQNVIVNNTCANLVLVDNHPFKAPANFTATSASYTTTINATAQAGTLCLPFAATLPEGVTAYALTYISGDEATATPVNGSITANTPVLINGSGEVTFTRSATASALNVQNDMTGVFEATAVPENSYVLQNGDSGVGFYRVSSSDPITIKPFRAYLTAKGSNAGAALRIVYPGDATGIEAVEKAADSKDDAYYTLSGVRVSHPVKGLYIKNGKKVMVK